MALALVYAARVVFPHWTDRWLCIWMFLLLQWRHKTNTETKMYCVLSISHKLFECRKNKSEELNVIGKPCQFCIIKNPCCSILMDMDDNAWAIYFSLLFVHTGNSVRRINPCPPHSIAMKCYCYPIDWSVQTQRTFVRYHLTFIFASHREHTQCDNTIDDDLRLLSHFRLFHPCGISDAVGQQVGNATLLFTCFSGDPKIHWIQLIEFMFAGQ